MKPSEIRDELLGQHAGLRGHLDVARLAAERWGRGELSRSDVHAALAQLADAMGTHNRREERTGFVDDDHVTEHRAMFDALTRVSRARDPREGGRELERFCERMLAHMTWEERAFLNATAMRDDDPSVDAEGG
jgi:hypothetical protein